MKVKRFAAILGLLVTPLLAHHKTSDYYDVTRPVTLKGVVREFIRANPHSFIVIDVKSSAGVAEGWAVEGDGPNNLIAAGWDLRSSGWDSKNMLQAGDTISLTAWPAKAGVKLADTLVIDEARMSAALLASMKRVAEIQRSGRLVHGIDVTLPDGRKLLFGEAGR